MHVKHVPTLVPNFTVVGKILLNLTSTAPQISALTYTNTPLTGRPAVHNYKLFWVAIVGYFFVAGPTLGYTYDANHRITVPNPTGTAILKFGE